MHATLATIPTARGIRKFTRRMRRQRAVRCARSAPPRAGAPRRVARVRVNLVCSTRPTAGHMQSCCASPRPRAATLAGTAAANGAVATKVSAPTAAATAPRSSARKSTGVVSPRPVTDAVAVAVGSAAHSCEHAQGLPCWIRLDSSV
jgi:hypothetical protein